jgi:trans-aconitate methyltransferase
MTAQPSDQWSGGSTYETFMGRWSRPVARAFIEWLQPKTSAHWLDVGCGTGALSSTICELSDPASVVGCDPSESFVAHAQSLNKDPRVRFVRGGSDNLPPGGPFDAVVSGLVLNFVPEPEKALRRMLERVQPQGFVAAYVWDYADGMGFLRHFWDEAVVVDPSASELDEGRRFPLCNPDALASLFTSVGLEDVETKALEIRTIFSDFDDFWAPFLHGPGPAPGLVASLDPERREFLRSGLVKRLPIAANGAIALRARAWAVRGRAGQ